MQVFARFLILGMSVVVAVNMVLYLHNRQMRQVLLAYTKTKPETPVNGTMLSLLTETTDFDAMLDQVRQYRLGYDWVFVSRFGDTSSSDTGDRAGQMPITSRPLNKQAFESRVFEFQQQVRDLTNVSVHFESIQDLIDLDEDMVHYGRLTNYEYYWRVDPYMGCNVTKDVMAYASKRNIIYGYAMANWSTLSVSTETDASEVSNQVYRAILDYTKHELNKPAKPRSVRKITRKQRRNKRKNTEGKAAQNQSWISKDPPKPSTDLKLVSYANGSCAFSSACEVVSLTFLRSEPYAELKDYLERRDVQVDAQTLKTLAISVFARKTELMQLERGFGIDGPLDVGLENQTESTTQQTPCMQQFRLLLRPRSVR